MFPKDGFITRELWSRICYHYLGPCRGGWGFRLSLNLGGPSAERPGPSVITREWVVTYAALESSERAGVLDESLMMRRLREERALLRTLARRARP